jgi:hypothetical protein
LDASEARASYRVERLARGTEENLPARLCTYSDGDAEHLAYRE